jgi:NAD(P)-dependent dehydrogenase (short-subunit alcohol dehydrogenase family)
MPNPSRRVAVINDGRFYVGPPLARFLATRDHDLVIGDASDELIAELKQSGVNAISVPGVNQRGNTEGFAQLTATALDSFGRIDSASMFSGQIITGSILKSSREDLDKLYNSCLVEPYEFLKSILPVMVEQQSGQVLIITSASGSRPTPGAPLYSSLRAAASMLARNAASEMARHNIQVNAIGTNYMDFPEFLRASGATDPEVRKKVEAQVPLQRLGTLDEFASFCMPFIDGTSRFATGQFVTFSGGWS